MRTNGLTDVTTWLRILLNDQLFLLTQQEVNYVTMFCLIHSGGLIWLRFSEPLPCSIGVSSYQWRLALWPGKHVSGQQCLGRSATARTADNLEGETEIPSGFGDVSGRAHLKAQEVLACLGVPSPDTDPHISFDLFSW